MNILLSIHKDSHQSFLRSSFYTSSVSLLELSFGAGRVAGGAMEVLSALRITQVFPEEFLNEKFPTFVH